MRFHWYHLYFSPNDIKFSKITLLYPYIPSCMYIVEANHSHVGRSLHPEPPPLHSFLSPPFFMGSYWRRTALTLHTPTSRRAMVGSFAWIPPSPHPLTTHLQLQLQGVFNKFNCLLWHESRLSEILSFLKAKGHTQNIKVIIYDFCLIFLCFVPIFFVKL